MSHETDRNVDDVGPGVMEALDQSAGEKIQGYVIGLALAVLLTAASFGAVYTDLIWGPAIPAALVALAPEQGAEASSPADRRQPGRQWLQ